MSNIARSLLGLSPYLEVMTRKVYWTNPGLHSAAQHLQHLLERPTRQTATSNLGTASFDDILTSLEKLGVSPGGILVVHSSMAELGKTKLSATSIIDRLKEFVGINGTLAMPAIPRYDDEPTGIERITADLSTTVFTYDVKRTMPWTGALPLKLMLRKDSIRSLHPLNSMVALGTDAEEMMARNLDGDRPLPCGVNSSWNYCLQKGAKIVFLGVDVAHSLTMIHVAEDAYLDTWPIANWYRERIFRVVDKTSQRNVTVRERHPKWAMHYAERTLARDLLRLGIQKSVRVSSIDISVVDAQELLAFLNSRKASGYPYFRWKTSGV